MHKTNTEEVFLDKWTNDIYAGEEAQYLAPDISDELTPNNIEEIIQSGKELFPEIFPPDFTFTDIELQVELEKLIKSNPLAQVGLRNMMKATGGDLSKVIKNIQSFNYNETGDEVPIAPFKTDTGLTRYGGSTRGSYYSDPGASLGKMSAKNNAFLFYNATDILDPTSDIGGSLGSLLDILKETGEPYPNINNLYKINQDGKKEFQTDYYNSLSNVQKKALQLQADARASSLDTLIHELMHHGTNVLSDSATFEDAENVGQTLERLRNTELFYGFDPETSNEHTLIDEILSGKGKLRPIDELMQLSYETNPALISDEFRKPMYLIKDPNDPDRGSLVRQSINPNYPGYKSRKETAEADDPSSTFPMYQDLEMLNSAAVSWLEKNSPPETVPIFNRPGDVNPRIGYESGDDDLKEFLSNQKDTPTTYREKYVGPDSFKKTTDTPETYTGPVPALMAKGGPVMALNEQTEMVFGDEPPRRDPVSGNEVPPGALPSEVRDDIPARLSEGEYVVPADVLQFYGIKFFEDLRTKAKVELSGLERDGRIGGESMEDNDFPFAVEELETVEDNTGENSQAFNEGGPVTEMETPYFMGGNQNLVKTYVNDAGLKMYIRFINGIAVPPIPPGYVEEGAALTPVQTETSVDTSMQDDDLGGTAGGLPESTKRPTLADVVNASMNPPFKTPAFGTLGTAAALIDKFFPTNSTSQVMAYVNEYGTLPPSGRGVKAKEGEPQIGDGFAVHPPGHPLEGTIVRELTSEDRINTSELTTFKNVIYKSYLKNTKDGKFNKKAYSEDIASSLNDDGTIKSDLTRARKRVDAITAQAEEEGTNILGTIPREAQAEAKKEQEERFQAEQTAAKTEETPTLSGSAYSGSTGGRREFGMNKGGLATRKKKKK